MQERRRFYHLKIRGEETLTQLNDTACSGATQLLQSWAGPRSVLLIPSLWLFPFHHILRCMKIFTLRPVIEMTAQ